MPPAPPTTQKSPTTGVYVVALTAEVDTCGAALDTPPISPAGLDELLAARPQLTLDGERPTADQLAARLAAFWLPDEVVVYIGLAGPRKKRLAQGEVAKRVCEYY